MLTGCTGGNAGIDAISSGTFGQANWTLEVELIDGKLLIIRVVGPVGFLTVILLVCLPGTDGAEFHTSLLSLMSPRLLELREAKQDQSHHDYCFYHPLALNLFRLCWDSRVH